MKLADDVPAARAALGLSPKQDDEIARNAALWTSPTMPALQRYTGVLYDALDVALDDPGPAGAGRTAAGRRARRCSGWSRAEDPIPAYRLSAGLGAARPADAARAVEAGALPRAGRRRRPRRRPAQRLLRRAGPGARRGDREVLSERPDGTRSVVSHFNKAHKGRLARLLATTTAEPDDVVRLRRLLRRAGLHVEHDGGTALTLVVPAP